MTQPDFSSPTHRLDNLAKQEFFIAYAMVRDIIFDPRRVDDPTGDLRIHCTNIDAQLADRFDIRFTALVRMLDAIGTAPLLFKDVKDRADGPAVGE